MNKTLKWFIWHALTCALFYVGVVLNFGSFGAICVTYAWLSLLGGFAAQSDAFKEAMSKEMAGNIGRAKIMTRMSNVMSLLYTCTFAYNGFTTSAVVSMIAMLFIHTATTEVFDKEDTSNSVSN